MASSNSWASLRQQARSLESQTENLLHHYSVFTSNPQPKPSDEELQVENDLQSVFERREATISTLARLLDSESALTSSAAKLQNLTLHRSSLADHRREHCRLKASITESRNRTNLLSSVRNDINAYRSASRLEEGRSEGDYMLDERDRLDRSHNVVDSVLNQAYAINTDFGQQRAMLTNINRRMVHTASQIPGINTLVTKISARKRRDSVILATLISFCVLMILWFR